MSDQCRAIVLGSLLGDGSLKIHKGYANARFSFRHSKIQEEYFDWKVKHLQEISSSSCVFVQKPDGFSKNEKLRYQSCALESLTDLYRLTHKQKRFRIYRTWLNQMTPLSLAIWWCDDGSIVGNGRKGVISTDGFDEKSVQILARYLQVVWKVNAHIGTRKQERGTRPIYYRLWMGTEELKKFLRLILPYIPVPSMLPKVLILYKDPQLQERWISEVAHATSFSHDTIERCVQEKKSRWKRYRK